MLGAAGVDLETACQMEAEEFAKLFGSPINRALLNVFFLHDRNKKAQRHRSTYAAKDRVGRRRRRRRDGAGHRGRQRQARHPRRAHGLQPRRSPAACKACSTKSSYNKQIKGPDVKRAVELAPLVNGTLSDIELCHSDIIVEAIIEKRDAKQHLFARLEPLMTRRRDPCSNTSTIPITQLADGLEHPERFCGLHFFNPVRQMPLVEVISLPRAASAAQD